MSKSKRKASSPSRPFTPASPARRAGAPSPDGTPGLLARFRWRLPAFLVFYTALGLAAVVLIYGRPLAGDPIRSDGLGYYIYLPAVFLDHDLTMRTLIEQHFHGIPVGASVTAVGDGHHYVDKFGPGVALMQAPFYCLARWVDAAEGLPNNPFLLWPFQYAMVLGGLVYGGIGLLFLWLALRRYYDDSTIVWTMLALLLGTDLFHYFTYDSTVNNHAFAFCLFSAFLWAVAGPRGASGRVGLPRLLFAGLMAGMIVIVRIPNVIWLVAALPLVLEESVVATPGEGRAFSTKCVPRALAACAAAAIPVALMMGYWKYVTGSFFYRTYTGETFNFLSPYIFSVLFSVKKGLFFWAPVLLLALPGAIGFARRAPALAWSMFGALALHTYIAASWWCWFYGGSFGHRAFVETLPVFAYPIAQFLQFGPRGRWAVAIRVALLVLVAWTIHLNLKYWFGMYSFDGPTWVEFRAMFLKPLPL